MGWRRKNETEINTENNAAMWMSGLRDCEWISWSGWCPFYSRPVLRDACVVVHVNAWKWSQANAVGERWWKGAVRKVYWCAWREKSEAHVGWSSKLKMSGNQIRTGETREVEHWEAGRTGWKWGKALKRVYGGAWIAKRTRVSSVVRRVTCSRLMPKSNRHRRSLQSFNRETHSYRPKSNCCAINWPNTPTSGVDQIYYSKKEVKMREKG